jgi:hypothetical protein
MMIVAASLFTSDHTRDFAYLLSPFPFLALAALRPIPIVLCFSLRVPSRMRLCVPSCSS